MGLICEECEQEAKKCDTCGADGDVMDEVYCHDLGHFCSEKCLGQALYESKGGDKLKAVSEVVVTCYECDAEIESCDGCGEDFYYNSDIICYGDSDKGDCIHVCSMDCLYEALSSNEDYCQTILIENSEDDEDE